MKIAVALMLMISCTIVANLLLKIGAMVPPGGNVFFRTFAWQTLTGILIFGCSLLIYMWVLRLIPLNIAQAFAAFQFVGVILASAVLLSEAIPPLRWVGLALISLGILLVGLTTYSSN